MPWELPELLEPEMVKAGWAELQTLLRLDETLDGIKNPRLKVSALEMNWYMRNQLLRDSDWAGMGHSVEIRVPFVDVDLLRVVAPLLASKDPPSKRDMAQSAITHLPSSVLDRRKTGFQVPVRQWLRDESRRAEFEIVGPAHRGLRGWAREVYSHFVSNALPIKRPASRRRVDSRTGCQNAARYKVLMLVRDAFGGFGGRQATAERGSDVEADIMVTLEEALHGSTRTVSLRRAGSNKAESYQVKIPRGVHEGQRIRLAGQGEAGARGGKSGDLFLRVRLARHPDFSVEGSDLIHELKIAPWQAALGAEIEVPTLEGSVRLKVPAGTQGGQRFRLRERGLPGVSGKRGDLYVDVQINVPKKLTEREREIWRELAKLHGG